jgi:propionyl-CoA synthetase
VGHSYIIYGPLIAGMATIMYEGPAHAGHDGQANGGIWWSLVENSCPACSARPTAVRVLKSRTRRCSKLTGAALFLAGEPLDEPTALDQRRPGRAIIDNYWQTESAITLMTEFNHGVEAPNSAAPCPWRYNIKLLHESTGEELDTAK